MWDKGPTGKPRPTDVVSQTFGGVYHTRKRKVVAPAKPADVHEVPCTRPQLRLICSNAATVEATGGRGGGKSDGGTARCVRMIAEGHPVGCVGAPRAKLNRVVWRKLLSMVPSAWLRDGKAGVRKSDKELHFRHGVIVQFVSAWDPDSLRSHDWWWVFFDEDQDVPTEAHEIALPCMRCTPTPMMWMALTPKPGEPLERHDENVADPDAECLDFDYRSNPWVYESTYERSKRRMSKTQYSIEILGSWETARQLVAKDRRPAFGMLHGDEARAKYVIPWPQSVEEWSEKYDITERLTESHRTTSRYGARKVIIGIDANSEAPNYAVVLKVFSPLESGAPRRWVVIDMVAAGPYKHCGHLAAELRAAKYYSHTSLLVPDASARYNQGMRSKNSSARLLSAAGYKAQILRTKNPSVYDSLSDLWAMLDPQAGDPVLYFAEQAEDVYSALVGALLTRDGRHLENTGDQHIVDALRYPISLMQPAAKVTPMRQKRAA